LGPQATIIAVSAAAATSFIRNLPRVLAQ
jgi:hypothetical protein